MPGSKCEPSTNDTARLGITNASRSISKWVPIINGLL
jgi:hypothetical protein